MENKKSITTEDYRAMETELLAPIQKIGLWGKIWIGFLLLICLAGLYAYYLQETTSKYETISLNDVTMWGVYISNFVFFVALSLVGALMSAVLKLIKFEWYRPLSRIAEIMAVAAIALAGVSIVAAMGRPDRLHFLFLYGRIQSPIVWDIIVIITYITASLLLLFLPLLPGITICRDKLVNKPKWQMWMYKKLSFGWTGSAKQWGIVKKSVKTLAIMVIPLGISIHTVTAWLFATTLRAEWDSTNFGPYFVSGAFLLGAAGMIIAVAAFRKYYRLQKYLTEEHFDKLGQTMVLLALVYLYFNVNEYLVPAYKMSSLHANHLLDLFTGETALLYWSVVFSGIVFPAVLPMFRAMRKPFPLTAIAVFVVIAAWFKRYLIVIPGLAHPYMPVQDVPQSWKHYFPSAVEITIVIATMAAMLLIVTLFSRFFPIISIWEVAEGQGADIEKIHTPETKKAEPVKKHLSKSLAGASALFLMLFSTAARPQSDFSIKLDSMVIDSAYVFKAAVEQNGEKAKDIGVNFFARRLFSPLPLGKTEYTDENGVALVKFPMQLPGDSAGNVVVFARLEEEEEVEAELTVPWGKKLIAQNQLMERALWASRSNAPFYLIITSVSIITGIWGTMGYIIFLLFFRMKKSG